MKTLLLLLVILTGCVPTHPRYVGVAQPTRVVYPEPHRETVEEARAAVTNFQVAQWMNASIVQSRNELAQRNFQRNQDYFDQRMRDIQNSGPRYFYGESRAPNGRLLPFEGWSY